VPLLSLIILREANPGDPAVTLSAAFISLPHRVELGVIVQGWWTVMRLLPRSWRPNRCRYLMRTHTLGWPSATWVEAEAPRPVDPAVEGQSKLKAWRPYGSCCIIQLGNPLFLNRDNRL